MKRSILAILLVLIVAAIGTVSYAVGTTIPPGRFAGGIQMTPTTAWNGAQDAGGVYYKLSDAGSGLYAHNPGIAETGPLGAGGSGGGGGTGGSGLSYFAQQDVPSLGAATTTSTTFVAMGNGTSTGYTAWSVTIPTAKTYIVTLSFPFYCNNAGQVGYFQLMLDGTAVSGQSTNAIGCGQSAINQAVVLSVIVAIGTTGAHSFTWQWKASSGGTLNTGGAGDVYRLQQTIFG